MSIGHTAIAKAGARLCRNSGEVLRDGKSRHAIREMKGIRTMQPTLTLLTALLLLPLAALNAAEFHVASSGNDANPGTKDQPFLTLERAREATRQLKETGPLKEPVTVVVRGGTYRLQASLILGTPDSGTEVRTRRLAGGTGRGGPAVRRCGPISRRVRSCNRRQDTRRVWILRPAARSCRLTCTASAPRNWATSPICSAVRRRCPNCSSMTSA